MNQPQLSAVETIESLQTQLRDTILEAYQLGEQLKTAEERAKTLRTALNGVSLGKKVAAEETPEEVQANT